MYSKRGHGYLNCKEKKKKINLVRKWDSLRQDQY